MVADRNPVAAKGLDRRVLAAELGSACDTTEGFVADRGSTCAGVPRELHVTNIGAERFGRAAAFVGSKITLANRFSKSSMVK